MVEVLKLLLGRVTEGVNIANFRGDVLMNKRGELGGVRIERQQYRRWGAN